MVMNVVVCVLSMHPVRPPIHYPLSPSLYRPFRALILILYDRYEEVLLDGVTSVFTFGLRHRAVPP